MLIIILVRIWSGVWEEVWKVKSKMWYFFYVKMLFGEGLEDVICYLWRGVLKVIFVFDYWFWIVGFIWDVCYLYVV